MLHYVFTKNNVHGEQCENENGKKTLLFMNSRSRCIDNNENNIIICGFSNTVVACHINLNQ